MLPLLTAYTECHLSLKNCWLDPKEQDVAPQQLGLVLSPNFWEVTADLGFNLAVSAGDIQVGEDAKFIFLCF